MSPTSAGGGTNTKTGGEHISRLVETPLFQFCLWQNWNNGVIIKRLDLSFDKSSLFVLSKVICWPRLFWAAAGMHPRPG